eukprot:2518201-Pyramimonas_sp.AAC.1
MRNEISSVRAHLLVLDQAVQVAKDGVVDLLPAHHRQVHLQREVQEAARVGNVATQRRLGPKTAAGSAHG